MKIKNFLLAIVSGAIFSCALAVSAEAAGSVAINSTNFPDEKFKTYVSKFDTNGDNFLSDAEINEVVTINVENFGISSLKGIEFFTPLVFLNCSRNSISELDLSKNTDLMDLDCNYNRLTEIDVSAIKDLRDFSCSGNSISSIDVSANTELQGVWAASCPITSVDLSKNTKLTDVGFSDTYLTNLDLSNNPLIKNADCMDCRLTSVNVSKCPRLEILHVRNNKLTRLDISKNPALISLGVSGNKLTSLNLSKNPNLQFVQCYDNMIQSLDVSANPNLETLDCTNNQIAFLDVSANPKLKTLSCANNQIAFLDLSVNEKMYVSADDNRHAIGKVTSFDLSSLKGFDPSRVLFISNSDWDKTTNIISNFTSDTLKCRYNVKGLEYVDFYWTLTEPPVPAPASGDGVWANGKDVKDDKKTADIDETAFYKTYSYQQVGNFSGGKWAVAVTLTDIDTTDKFAALFDDKGKLTPDGKTAAGKAKKLASAKIKDGKVTVTAGKEAGTVNVWVYELKNKKVVVDKSLNIAPMKKTVGVYMASASPVLAQPEDLTDGVLATGKKAVTKLTLLYKNGSSSQEGVTLAIGDKKTKFDDAATFTTEIKEGENSAVKVSQGTNEITVSPVKAGKSTVTLTNVQSGKKTKLTVTAVNAYKATVPAGASVKYKSDGKYVEVKDGDYVPEKAKLEISASGKKISVNGTEAKNGNFTVGGAEVVIAVE